MQSEPEIVVDENLIAYCGLYCGSCTRYQSGKCGGCKENKASWCKVKPCNIKHGTSSCAECAIISDVSECKKYNPIFVRIFEALSKGSRRESVKLLKEKGGAEFSKYMAANRLVAVKKSGR
ncbi:MAG TPA: DUF3795 domain-containing protein [Candidatus Kryptonia bacterium]